VTYVFTDIAGFTTLAESTEPEVMSRLLNSYLDGLCGLFLEHGATIDKLIGDAVVGFFGAPIEQPDHAERAVGLVLAVDAFSQSFRQAQTLNGLALGITRIGAHTGPAIIGNFGGKKFFDYTGLGDTVNTAARLEGANKVFGTRVCVSGPVAALSPAYRFRPIASVVLKGKLEAVDVFEPLRPDSLDTELEATYGAAYALIERGDNGALAALEDLAARWPDDRLVEFHLRRLHRGETGVRIAMIEK
jgi:class 3 adenylate cyclase